MATRKGGVAATTQAPLPYGPSWIDRLMRAVERLPVPYWITYLLAAALESLLVHIAAWLDGTMPPWTIQPIFLLFPIRIWLSLALMTYLNHEASQALRDFRPLLDSDEAEARLRYELTTLPMQPVLVTHLLGFLYFLFLVLYRPIEAIAERPLLTPVYLLSGFGAFMVATVIYYHSFHQLRLVWRIYAGVRSFNLFRLEPVYAFSRLTALTGGAYLLLISLNLLLFPYPMTDVRVVVSYLLQIVLSMLVVVLPLWTTHQRLATEKRRLLYKVQQRMEATFQQMHRHLDDSDDQALAGSKAAVESLVLERKVIEEIPTWPWQPGTIRALVTAFFLPLLLFIGQLIIARWLTE